MTAHCASLATQRKSFSHWGQIEVPEGTEYRYSMGHPHQDYGYDARYLHGQNLSCLPAVYQLCNFGPYLD
jgi:hypothetical protein